MSAFSKRKTRPVVVGNKSSAIDEMGDRFATIDMGRKVGTAVPLSVSGAGAPSNTMWPGQAFLRTKWHLDPSNV